MDNLDFGTAPTEMLEQYIKDRIKGYEDSGACDSILWETFQEDFDLWTEDIFNKVRKVFLKTLRFTLKQRGVWVSESRSIAKTFKLTLDEKQRTKWTDADINK